MKVLTPSIDVSVTVTLVFITNITALLAVVSDAVQKELEEPGLLLGYRTMIQKLRTEFNVQVPRHLVSTRSLDCILKDSRQEAFKDEIKIPKFSLHLNGLSW